MTEDLEPQTAPIEPETVAPERSSGRANRRQRILVALPLVLTLLAAGGLLWTRAEPSRRGDFCSRATVEAVRVVRASDGSVRVQYDQSMQVDALLEQAAIVRVDQLIDGAPADLRKQLIAADEILPEYRRQRAAAKRAGRTPPEPPKQLRETALAFLATYLGTCIRSQS